MKFTRHFSAILVAITLAFSGLCCHVSAADKNNDESYAHLEKAYQEVLYHYFQGDFEQALTQFSLLEAYYPNQLSKIPNPGVSPELLKGGISLAFGLDQQAAEIFRRLLSQSTEPKTRVLAWMMLGKSMYQKRLYKQASEALGNISADDAKQYLDNNTKDELVYLRSQLFTTQNESDISASNWLSQLSGDSVYYDYVRYNQGLAALMQDDYQGAVDIFNGFSESRTSSWFSWFAPLQSADKEELDAIRDRAFLTLGYAHLQKNQANLAMQSFNQVRLESLDTQAAILGYGWAASMKEDYQLALSVWSKLQQNSQSSEYVLEAYLASAYAYEKAFAPSQALTNLQLGLDRYQSEAASLEALRSRLDDTFFTELAQTQTVPQQLPIQLTHLLLKKSVRVELQNLRDSMALKQQLTEWQSRLVTFHLMLDEREVEAQTRTASLKQNATLNQLSTLKQERDRLAQTILDARDEPSLLMPQQSLDWQARLQRAIDNKADIDSQKAQLTQKPLSQRYQARLDRLQGIMLWNANEASSERVWQAQKQLAEVDNVIVKTTAQQAILTARVAQKPEYPQQRARIETLQQRLVEQLGASQKIIDNQLTSLNQKFMQEFELQLTQLKDYQLQAQLALVRLNDEAFRKIQAEQRQGGQPNGL